MKQNGNRYRITLPSFPNQWNDIPTDKLEEILRLMAMRQGEIVTKGEEVADRLYRLRVLLCLLDMKIVRRTVSDEDGETVFIFHRRGIRHIFERIPMRAWQVNQWIDSRLQFLDRPTALLKSPYPYVSLRRGKLKLKGPANMLGDVTFQQYLVAQNTLTSYWNTIKSMEEAIRTKAGRKTQRQLLKRASELRCRFLATLFCPSAIETGKIQDGRFIRTPKRKVWAFSMNQTEDNARYFRKVEDRMFPVMELFFQSVQEAYSRLFPDLYTPSGKGKKVTNPIVQEVSMVNSIQKEQGYSSTEEIYRSLAVQILEVMNSMCKKAKEIERMNQRMSKK